MKSHELAKFLLENPDSKVVVGVDTSTCEDNWDDRTYSHTLWEVTHQIHKEEIYLFFIEGYDNKNPS